MPADNVIVRFNTVSFEYGPNKPILQEADFSVRNGFKATLMGQNGAGKSTIFQLITGVLKPDSGAISLANGLTIATARQVIPRDQMTFSVREFFEQSFSPATLARASGGRGKIYDIDPRIDDVLEIVNLKAPHDRIMRTFSGGQQARLLLASALIQSPDLLLLDEPTNNLDKAGIAHLTQFLINYKKTCIVISHDAEFLNAFTQGVLYLDIFTHKVEQYAGNYFDVVSEIEKRLERERMKNVRLEKDIANRREQAGFFAQKGGHMRDVARKMREKIEELEEGLVDVRREDKTIRNFVIPCQEDLLGNVLELNSVTVVKNHKPVSKKVHVVLKKGDRLLLTGPNGIGKTTLLEKLAAGHARTYLKTPPSRVRSDFLDPARRAEEAVAPALQQREATPRGEEIARTRRDAANSGDSIVAPPRSIAEDTPSSSLRGLAGIDSHRGGRSFEISSGGEHVAKGVRIGYYRQDFGTLDFNATVYEALAGAMQRSGTDHELRSRAAGFLLDEDTLKRKIGVLSEGQKGLVSFACLTLQRPGLLILDEPTNHINFRHIPTIAETLNRYEGAMILVSHVPDFVAKIKMTQVLDLEAL